MKKHGPRIQDQSGSINRPRLLYQEPPGARGYDITAAILKPTRCHAIQSGSNALIVRETESKLAIVKQLVEGLDLEVPQVQIEARIVQADTVYARGLGIQWGVKNSQFHPK